MSLQNHALYQVATKALLFNGQRILVLITPDGFLDFPGGRVEESERDLPWTEALKREVAEELGNSIVMEIGHTLFVSKRQYHKEGKTFYIAAIFFKCQYIRGDIELSDEHGSYNWLTSEEIINHRLKFISKDEKKQLTQMLKGV